MPKQTVTTTCRTALTAAAAIAMLAGTAAGQTIKDIAPRNAVVVAGVDDFAALQQAADRAGLMDLWNEPSVQQWIDETMAEAMDEMNADLQELGFTMDDLSTPEGPIGFALFIDEDAEDARDSEYHFIAMSDFGDNADQMAELLMANLERAEDNGEMTYTEDDYRGVTIYSISPVESEEEDGGMEDWGDWEDEPDVWDTTYYARSGSSMMIASSLRALESAIEKATGEPGDEDVTGLDGWQATMRLMDDQPQAYFISVTEPWFDLARGIQDVSEAEAMDASQVPPVMEMLNASGLADVQGFGMSLNLDADGAVATSKFVVSAPELRGFLSLIPTNAKPLRAPDFVSADVDGLSLAQFDFSNLFSVIREFATNLPPEAQGQIIGGLGMAEGFAGPMLRNLGPELYFVQDITQPYAADSAQTLVAFTAGDENAIRQTLQQLLAMSGMQLETREFAGGTIWQLPEQMMGAMGGGGMGMPDFSQFGIALGAGHFFVGQVPQIEMALRTAGEGGAARLKDDERFTSAMANLPANGLAFSWSDTEENTNYYQWMVENMDEIQREQLRAMGMSEEEIDQQMQWMGGNPMTDFMENLPDLGLLNDYMGDSVMAFEIVDGGIVATSKVLRPE